jgi:hypothetical protein
MATTIATTSSSLLLVCQSATGTDPSKLLSARDA